MARIIISICGEGRGHASRAISLIERLHPRHELLLMSFGDGYNFLLNHINSTGLKIDLVRIEGINYLYNKRGHLAPVRTYLCWARFIFVRIRRHCMRVDKIVLSFKPDLAIVDFEPCLPRVASRRNIPCISVDHQHFIRFCNNDILPLLLRIRAFIGGWVCRFYVPRANLYVITAFFRPKLRINVRQELAIIGPIIRNEIRNQPVTDDGIVLSYLRRSMPENLKEAFLSCGYPVIVYGLGKRAAIANIKFKNISQNDFVKDLARATAIIGAAGNQLIGESLYMRKPIYALPEKNHHEQIMNSCYLSHSGNGTFTFIEDLKVCNLKAFMETRGDLKNFIMGDRHKTDALDDLQNIIEHFLSQDCSRKNNSLQIPNNT